jgi:hypothetical protein
MIQEIGIKNQIQDKRCQSNVKEWFLLSVGNE